MWIEFKTDYQAVGFMLQYILCVYLAGIDVAVDGLDDQVGVEASTYHQLVLESQAGLIVLTLRSWVICLVCGVLRLTKIIVLYWDKRSLIRRYYHLETVSSVYLFWNFSHQFYFISLINYIFFIYSHLFHSNWTINKSGFFNNK